MHPDRRLVHPDYVDYVVQKRNIHPRAKWHDIKFLCRKLLGLELNQIYVERIDHNDWDGWLVQFACDVDLSEIKRNVSGCIMVGERVIYIGVNYG